MPEFISYDKLSYVPKLLATTFGHPTMNRGNSYAVDDRESFLWESI